jgi:signal transduction histidine kinase
LVVTAWRGFRPTPIESGLGAVLLCLSVVEMLFSDEQPTPNVVSVIAAVVPPVLVAFSRTAPEAVMGVAIVVSVVDSLEASVSGTFGAGVAGMVLVFALAAWSRQPWPWLVAAVVATTMQDLRTVNFDLSDVLIDWVFIGFVVLIGRMVHRRAAQAGELDNRLRLAELDRDARTRDAVSRERARIARELHDIVAHAVSLMVVQAGTARPRAERHDRELADVLGTIEHSGREALMELRRLLHVLRSDDEPDLQPVPDLARLGELVDGVRRTGLEVRTSFDIPSGVPPGVALCAYRVVQEGLTNAVRYANTSLVDVAVWDNDGALSVEVQDHGGSAAAEAIGAGTGLVGLRERVLLCGGQLEAGSAGPGYLLRATLPLHDVHARSVEHRDPGLAG